MSDPSDSISFDKADIDGSTGTPECATCRGALTDDYFDVNGSPTCATCKDALIAHLITGSNWKYVPRALWLGACAAALGCLIYYLIRRTTGYEFGLVAIIVGLMVGGAVNKGSRGRGGPLFQSMAMGLTYLAIVFTYSPDLFLMLRDQSKTAPDPLLSLLGMAVLVGILLAIPFLAGIKNAMGLFIIGVALYEAWKLNKRPALNINGPLRIQR